MPSTACSGVSSAMRPACTSSSCCCKSAMRRCKCSVRLCGSGVERGGQVVDFALHHRQARRGGGHHPPIELRNEAQRGFQRIGLKHPPLTLYHQPAPNPRAPRAGPGSGVSSLSISKSTSLACTANISASACTAASNGTPSRWCSNSASRQLSTSGARREEQQPRRVLLAGGDVFTGCAAG